MVKMYAHWRTEDLKKELRRRGASLKGRKADLVQRLESYDRNNNFDALVTEPNEDKQMIIPEPGIYKDINSSMTLPPISKGNLTLYLLEFQKSIKKGRLLYNSGYLHVLRAAFVGETCFIKGLVKATMKQVLYEVNIKVNPQGEIEETSCECVAGSGVNAHCKHVEVVFCALEHWCTHKTLIKSLSCTEQLQTFHRPSKVFTGSPIQTKNLNKRKRENINFDPYKGVLNNDMYRVKVQNIIMNWNGEIPLKQCIEPANPYGLDNDHNYCGLRTQHILNKLKVENISTGDQLFIEKETRGQSENPEWIRHRKCRMTASVFHTICHLKESTKRSYARQLLLKDEFHSRATTHGILNEKVALQKYREDFGLDIFTCGLYLSVSRPYLGASPDGLLGDETVIEIKCPYASRNVEINHVTVPYLYRDSNEQLQLKETSPYFYQIQGQLYSTNRKYCNLIVYTYKDMKVIFINRNDDFINVMLNKLDSFYNNYFRESILNEYFYKDYITLIKKS